MLKIIETIIWALVIIEQPSIDSLWVSRQPDAVTHWAYVDRYDVYGLLAHDYMAGDLFDEIAINDQLFADGWEYQVSELVYFDETYSDEMIFEQIYTQPNRLVLQTCWQEGFMFVIADPADEYRADLYGRLVLLRPEAVTISVPIVDRYFVD